MENSSLYKNTSLENKELSMLLESVVQAVWETDAYGKVVKDSPSWRAYTGQTYEEWAGDGWINAVHPDDRDYALNNWLRAIEAKTNYSAEYRLKDPHGDWRWTNVIALPIYDGNGKIKKWVGINKNISREKKTEMELLEAKKQSEIQNRHLERILESIPSAVVIVRDEDGKFSYMNKRAEKLYGIDYTGVNLDSHRAEVKVMRVDGTPYPLEEIPVNHTLKYGREVHNREMIFRNADGISRHVLVSSSPLFDAEGKVNSAIVNFNDITEQKCGEEALKKTQEKYRNLFNSMDEAFCIIEIISDEDNMPVDYRFVETNPAFERQTGMKNAKGKCINEVSSMHPEHLFETFGKVSLTGEPVSLIWESKNVNCWYNINTFRIEAKDKREVAVLFNDITSEVKARKDMEKTLKMQEEVFANVSHELKTPLNVIFCTNQLMEMYLNNGFFERKRDKVLKGLKTIRQNCYRFTKLINNIVDISKAESGFLKLNLSNENIVQITEDITQSVSEYIKGKGIDIVFDTNTEEKIMACDPAKIERIILNIISNAIKFTNPGGSIFVNLADKGDNVEITVRDTGIGMEKEQLVKIFKRFHQVDKSLSRNAEGSGIGLSLVKYLVELHLGEITVDSEVGKGSIFKIELPASKLECSEVHRQMNCTDSNVEMINIEFSDIYT